MAGTELGVGAYVGIEAGGDGWAEMIRKVYEVDPMVCPKCGATMKVIAFITEYAVVDRIIDYLKLTVEKI